MNGSLRFKDVTDPSGIASRFILSARNDPRNNIGFRNRNPISWEDHVSYMQDHLQDYKLVEGFAGIQYFETDFGRGQFDVYMPVGYFGIIKNDIRFCVFPQYRKAGVGSAILMHIKEQYPLAIGRIFPKNTASIKAFIKAKVPFTLVDDPNDREENSTQSV